MSDFTREQLVLVLTAAEHLDAVVNGFLDGKLTLKALREAKLSLDELAALERVAGRA